MAKKSSNSENLKRQIDRNWLRARNGIKFVSGGSFVKTGASPKDIIWRKRKAELWHYRSEQVRYKTPVLVHLGLVSKSYVFDLHPGNSFVEKLLNAGFDVYVLDWGIPDEADADNTIATYVLELMPRAMQAMLDHSGAEDFNLISYCMGGCLSLPCLALRQDIPIRSIITMAVPSDFTKHGEMMNAVASPDLDIDSMLDESGNVPANLIHDMVRVRTPTSGAVQYANLWQNLWNDEFLEGFQAMRVWIADHLPMPGAFFREIRKYWLIDNGFLNGTFHLNGQHVDLSNITCPVLCLLAERDELVPLESSTPLPGLLTGADVRTEILRSGHVGLTCGRAANKYVMPLITSWLGEHSDASDT